MGGWSMLISLLAAGRLVERMRRFKPDVVMTFGGDGGLNTHADHMMVFVADYGGVSLGGADEAVSGAGGSASGEAAVST